MRALLAASLCAGATTGSVTWNNHVPSFVWEPNPDKPVPFQPKMHSLSSGFQTDLDGTSVAVGRFHACVIEPIEDNEVGGRVTCWHASRDRMGITKAPEVRFPNRRRIVPD